MMLVAFLCIFSVFGCYFGLPSAVRAALVLDELEVKMNTLQLILTIIQVLSALALVAIVILQSGKSAGLSGAIAGAADSFMSKNKRAGLDAKLARFTKWIAAVFIILTFVLNLL